MTGLELRKRFRIVQKRVEFICSLTKLSNGEKDRRLAPLFAEFERLTRLAHYNT